uniref:Ciliary neurotrophic factor n=1 Tax=Branchiostoma floridae TaxID=7739 RepID=C3ZF17_BRAFL|eukprot:XP_002593312.1 hypothetical protein BRAFLDRAFT_83860 [Branchiostoma floridae]
MEAFVHLYMIVLMCGTCILPDLAAAVPVIRHSDPAAHLPDSTAAAPVARLPDPAATAPVARLPDPAATAPVARLRDPTAAAPVARLQDPTARLVAHVPHTTPVTRRQDPAIATPAPVTRRQDPAVAIPVARLRDLPYPAAAPQATRLPDPTAADPVARLPNPAAAVTRVPDPGFQQPTLVQALTQNILGTNWTLALTAEAIRAMREVHFGDPHYDPGFEQPAWANSTVTVDDVESGRLEDSEILDRISSQLYIYKQEVGAVMQDEMMMMTSDAAEGGIRRVYQLVEQVYFKAGYMRRLLARTAHLMGHDDLESDHATDFDPAEPTSEYEKQLRALRVFLAYQAYLGQLRGVFAALLQREVATTARLGPPTSPALRNANE